MISAVSIHFADDASEVGEEVGAEIRFDQWAAFAGGEDQVEQDVSGCVGHVRPRGFSLRVSGRHTVESQTGDMVDSFRDMIFALGEGFGR